MCGEINKEILTILIGKISEVFKSVRLLFYREKDFKLESVD